ncbi:hypothetical protein IOQ59_19115 [Pontibacterium sp. N1Y112]|uniref:FlgO domain-containing protein n=1 Tax=Pontibacterium sinense TaxID=2781979 RepID=A0A8J7JZZ1_9GAMM|nr:hypothetical protein [Pontibacterium sinense]MBE9399378.1 hypothetical protein [Pontibacterium sinense]
MVKNLLMLGTCAGLLSGCYQANTSQTPTPTAYSTSEQQKMQAAHHWDVLAAHEARLITTTLQKHNVPLHVSGGDADTPFYNGYKNLLTSQLVTNGAIVRSTGSGSAQVSFDVNVIEHKDRDSRRKPAGSWTLLATGVVVAAHAVEHWSTPAKLLFPAAIGADIYSGNWIKDTDFEVIITTTVIDKNQIIHSSSNIYYINGGDAQHYAPQENSTSKIRVTDRG